jgi:iron-sulfur cluster assembly accessory protein|tara:strand:+ start:3166 stop:3483 length:318 start_codon:yes stop_codon:yes gene_type:complete
MLSFTEAAVSYLNQVLDEGDVLRVRVKGGGCSGFSYDMEVQEEQQVGSEDNVTEDHGFKVVIDQKSNFMLAETQVDYQSTLSQSGFKFSNAKATKTCGCGTSFSC